MLFCLNSVVDVDDHTIDPFYQGFINALIRNGNDVFLFRTNDFLTYSNSEQELLPYINKKKLNSYIKSIEPDVIFTFNNNIYADVFEYTECPVVFFASESYDFLQSIDLIKKYKSRYYYIYFSEDSRVQMINNMVIDKNRTFVTHISTDIKNERIEYERNISFIGCVHYLPSQVISQYKKCITNPETRMLLFSTLNYILINPLSKDIPNLDNLKNLIGDSHMKTTLMNLLSRNLRLETLNAVSDLGLRTYGKNFLQTFSSFPNVALSFEGHVSTLAETSHIYNSSKISLNIPHVHSVSSFTWRVPEIMASNSVLVSKTGLNKVFGDKFKLPTFENPYEARQLCKKFLEEENFRYDLIQYSNEFIDKQCRFEQRLEELEKLLHIVLLNKNIQGRLFYINIKNYYTKFWIAFENVTASVVNKLPNKAILSLGKLAKPLTNYIPKSVKKFYAELDKNI